MAQGSSFVSVTMGMPLISCVVPVFNGERYLADTLRSVLHQTYRPLEIIVVDDGSTDGTAELLGRYDEQARYIWQPNAGPSSARNQGVRAAEGTFVAFLDQDDMWHPEKLSRQMARFAARADLDLCVTHVRSFYGPEPSEKVFQFADHRLSRSVPGYLTGTLLARRSVFETVGIFDIGLRYGDATDWFLHAAERGMKMELLADVLMYRRIHHNNFSRRHASASCDEFLGIIKHSLDRRRDKNRGIPVSYKFPRAS